MAVFSFWMLIVLIGLVGVGLLVWLIVLLGRSDEVKRSDGV